MHNPRLRACAGEATKSCDQRGQSSLVRRAGEAASVRPMSLKPFGDTRRSLQPMFHVKHRLQVCGWKDPTVNQGRATTVRRIARDVSRETSLAIFLVLFSARF